jgi:hypothetical protein
MAVRAHNLRLLSWRLGGWLDHYGQDEINYASQKLTPNTARFLPRIFKVLPCKQIHIFWSIQATRLAPGC